MIERLFVDLDTKPRSYEGIKLLGLLAPAAKGKCLLGPKSWQRDEMFLESGAGPHQKS